MFANFARNERRIEMPLSNLVDEAIRLIDQRSAPMVAAIEYSSPHHRFGATKRDHMLKLVSKVDQIAAQENLSQREALLLKVVARAHDLGRHVEALRELDTLRAGPRHGFLSAELLDQWGVLKHFDPADARIVKEAVQYHAEKDVPLEGTARKLCYLIRDLDKLSIISDKSYLQPDGMLAHIRLHYLTAEERRLSGEPALIEAFKVLGALSKDLHWHGFNQDERALIGRFQEIESGGVPREIVSKFCDWRSIEVQQIRHSYATYMLYTIAMIFDVDSSRVLGEVFDRRLLDDRLEFVRARVCPEDFQAINNALVSFYSRKMGNRSG